MKTIVPSCSPNQVPELKIHSDVASKSGLILARSRKDNNRDLANLLR
jgi:hypothetical protein